jgi:membrane protein implicated in regulation of membrane protease activity
LTYAQVFDIVAKVLGSLAFIFGTVFFVVLTIAAFALGSWVYGLMGSLIVSLLLFVAVATMLAAQGRLPR